MLLSIVIDNKLNLFQASIRNPIWLIWPRNHLGLRSPPNFVTRRDISRYVRTVTIKLKKNWFSRQLMSLFSFLELHVYNPEKCTSFQSKIVLLSCNFLSRIYGKLKTQEQRFSGIPIECLCNGNGQLRFSAKADAWTILYWLKHPKYISHATPEHSLFLLLIRRTYAN